MTQPVRNVTAEDASPEEGFQTDYRGKTIDAYFGSPPAQYTAQGFADDPWLWIVVEDEDGVVQRPEGYTLGAGKKWQITRDGHEVISQKQPDSHRFNRSSKVISLVDAITDLAGKGDKVAGEKAFLIDRHIFMTDAEAYIGIASHWATTETSTPDAEKKTSAILPTDFLTFVGGTPAPAAKAATPATKQTAIPAATPASNGIDVDAILAFADGKTYPDLKKLGMKTWGPNGSNTDLDIMNFILDPANMKALEGQGKLMKDAEGVFVVA